MLGAAWGLAVGAWVLVALLSDQYEAVTRIYVDTDNLLTPLLRNITVETDLQNELEVLQRTLLSRTNIAQVVHTAGLDVESQDPADLERLYQVMQKKIQVKVEGRNLFSVTYRHKDPRLAQQVVASLLDIFVASNIGHNRSNMEDARSFIDGQIGEYEDKLKDADRRLAEYKGKHMDVLAATGNNFSPRLEAAREELTTAQVKLRETVVARDQVQAGLVGVPQFLDVDVPGQVVFAPAAGPVAASPAARVRQLENELAQLLSHDTDRHPDVVTTRRALAAARLAAAADDGGAVAGKAPSTRNRVANTVYDQLKLRLVQAEADVASARSRVELATSMLHRLESLGEVAPKVEADLADLNREYGVLKAKYEELLGRRESARISAAVETSGDKVQFRVIEIPHVPLVPVFPNRPLLMTAALAVAVAAGLGIGVGLDKMDETIGSPEALARMGGIRVLGCVPRLEAPEAIRRRRMGLRRFAALLAGLPLSYVVVMALVLIKHPASPKLVPPPPPFEDTTVSHGP